MGEERKPQGKWEKIGKDRWSLRVQQRPKVVFYCLGEYFSDEIEGTHATLEAAQLAVEDDVRERAFAMLRAIGIPPLGEVIGELHYRAHDELRLQVDITGLRAELYCASVVDISRHGKGQEIAKSMNHHDDPDGAIREVAKKLEEARDAGGT